jgi:hypothetical protein
MTKDGVQESRNGGLEIITKTTPEANIDKEVSMDVDNEEVLDNPIIVMTSPIQKENLNKSFTGITPGHDKQSRRGEVADRERDHGRGRRNDSGHDRRRDRAGNRSRSRDDRYDRNYSGGRSDRERERDRDRGDKSLQEIMSRGFGQYYPNGDKYAADLSYKPALHDVAFVNTVNRFHPRHEDLVVLENMERETGMISDIQAKPEDYLHDACMYAALVLREIRYWSECKKNPGVIANIGWPKPFSIKPSTINDAKSSGVNLTEYTQMNQAKLIKQLENLAAWFTQNGVPAFLWGLKAIEFFNVQNTTEMTAYVSWYTENRPKSFYYKNCMDKLVELFCGGTHCSKFDLGDPRFNPADYKTIEDWWRTINQRTADANIVLDTEYKDIYNSEKRKVVIDQNEYNLNLILSWVPVAIKSKLILEINTKNPSKEKNPELWRPKYLMEMVRSRFGNDYPEWKQAWVDEARTKMSLVFKVLGINPEDDPLFKGSIKYATSARRTTPENVNQGNQGSKPEAAKVSTVKKDYSAQEFLDLTRPPFGACFNCFKDGHKSHDCKGVAHKNSVPSKPKGDFKGKRNDQLKAVETAVKEKSGIDFDNDDINNFRIKQLTDGADDVQVAQEDKVNNVEIEFINSLINPSLLIDEDLNRYVDHEWPKYNDPFTLCLLKEYDKLKQSEDKESYLFEPNVEIVTTDPFVHELTVVNEKVGEVPTFFKLNAFEDSLSDGHGAIRESELIRMGIGYTKREIVIQTADASVGAALGYVRLPVHFLAFKARANFLVLDKCPYPCIMGRDLMCAFKLKVALRVPVTDFARKFDMDELHDESDIKEELDEDLYLNQTDLKDRLIYNDMFLELVADNQLKVPKNAQCTYPGALIKIEFDEMVKANRFRQQFKQERIIEDILYIYVKVWLADNICEVHDRAKHGEHEVNTPLLGVAQKNARGEIMKVRGVFACNDSVNNGLLTQDTFPLNLPQFMYEEVGSYGPDALYTVIDITDAFTSIGIRQEDIGKMAFMLKGVVYVFKRAAMGLKFMPSFFQRLMTSILSGLKGVIVYIDDIWIMTGNDMNAHYELVKEVMRRLTEATLRVSPHKCKFMTRKFKGLGYIVTPQGTQIDPDRVANIQEMPLSASYAALATFIFTCEFLHSRIPKFAEICKPLHDLLNKGKASKNAKHSKTRRPPWEDFPVATNAFFKMKDMLGSATMLWHYDPNKPLFIAVDASTTGHGSILYQPRWEGDNYPCAENIVSYRSHGWKKEQRRYFQNAYRLEFMGLIQALKDHRQYIWGRKFTVFTDHKPLTTMFSEGAMNKHIASYLDVLMEYDFDIMYIPGETNVLPDGMSRMRQEKLSTELRTEFSKENIVSETTNATIDTVNTDDEYPSTLPKNLSHLCALKWDAENNIMDPTEKDMEFGLDSAQSELTVVKEKMLERLQTGQRKIISQVNDNEESDDKIYGFECDVKLCSLWIQGEIDDREADILKLCALNRKANINTDVHGIRPEIREKLEKLHSLGHYGLRHMLSQLKLHREGWKNMHMDVREFLRSCITCAKWNLGEQMFHELRAVVADLPWDHLQIDYITSFNESGEVDHLIDSAGYKYILVIVDIFTGFTVLKPCKTRDADECAKILWEVYQIMGVPKILQSDNDKSFVSALMKNMCDTLKQVKLETHPYTHRELGKAESMVKIVSKCIRTLMTDLGSEWIEILPVANIAVNATIKELTGMSPYMMMFNRPVGVFEQCKLPVDINDEISLEAKNLWLNHQRNVLEQLFPATRERINAMKQRYKMDFAKKHKIAQTTLPIGAKVMLKELVETNKNIAFYYSLFEVIKVHDNYTYDIKDAAGNILEEQPIDHLKVLPIGKDAMGETYLVDRIIGSKKDEDNKWLYKVRYLGYDSDEDRWVHVKDLSDVLINNYWLNSKSINNKKRSVRDAEFDEKDEDGADEVDKPIARKVRKINNKKIVDVTEVNEDDELLCNIEPALAKSIRGRNLKPAGVINVNKM